MSTHKGGNFNITSSATMEISGQNIDSKQKDNREACQFTFISEIKQKIIKQQNPYYLLKLKALQFINRKLRCALLKKAKHENISGIRVCTGKVNIITTAICICTVSLTSTHKIEYWLPGITIGASGARQSVNISVK